MKMEGCCLNLQYYEIGAKFAIHAYKRFKKNLLYPQWRNKMIIYYHEKSNTTIINWTSI